MKTKIKSKKSPINIDEDIDEDIDIYDIIKNMKMEKTSKNGKTAYLFYQDKTTIDNLKEILVNESEQIQHVVNTLCDKIIPELRSYGLFAELVPYQMENGNYDNCSENDFLNEQYSHEKYYKDEIGYYEYNNFNFEDWSESKYVYFEIYINEDNKIDLNYYIKGHYPLYPINTDKFSDLNIFDKEKIYQVFLKYLPYNFKWSQYNMKITYETNNEITTPSLLITDNEYLPVIYLYVEYMTDSNHEKILKPIKKFIYSYSTGSSMSYYENHCDIQYNNVKNPNEALKKINETFEKLMDDDEDNEIFDETILSYKTKLVLK